MVLLDEAVEAKRFDVRVIERNVQRGHLRAEDVQKAIHSLPDDGDNASYVSIDSIAADNRESQNGHAGTQH